MKTDHQTIHIHIYRNKPGFQGVAKNENGKVINDNHLVKLSYGALEWTNYLSNLKASGIIKVDVVGFLKKDWKEGPFTYDKADPDVQAEVDIAMGKDPKPAKASKKAKEEAPAEKSKEEAPAEEANADKGDGTPDVNEELEVAQAKWEEVFGKPPHPRTGLKRLNAEIAEKSAE